MKPAYKDFGEGKAVVLIHAFPLSSAMWNAQAESLAARGFRVILPDLPGFGENKLSSRRFSLEEMANQIAELLDSLNIEKAIFGGLSMGGYVLFEFLRKAPEKIAALIFCDTTYSADTDEKRRSRFELISKIEKAGSAALIDNMLPNLVSDVTKQNNPQLTGELEQIFEKVDSVAASNALKSMAERRDHLEIIDSISVPTLLVFGEFDKITNLETAQKMDQIIPDSELVIIKSAGHYSNLEQPEQFNRALVTFCENINY